MSIDILIGDPPNIHEEHTAGVEFNNFFTELEDILGNAVSVLYAAARKKATRTLTNEYSQAVQANLLGKAERFSTLIANTNLADAYSDELLQLKLLLSVYSTDQDVWDEAHIHYFDERYHQCKQLLVIANQSVSLPATPDRYYTG